MLSSRKQRLANMVLLFLLSTSLGDSHIAILAEEASSAESKEPSTELSERINRLIQQLDDDSFRIREEAERALIEIGLPAWDAVSRASKGDSAETKWRARRVLVMLGQLKKDLQYVDSVSQPALSYVVSATLSADGKYLYSASWQGNTICVFSRDVNSGGLELIQTIDDKDNLAGAISVQLSSDGRYALATAFRSQTAILYLRDAMTGKLTLSDMARQGQNGVDGLHWSLDSVFSPDSRFVYVIDPGGSGNATPRVDGQPGAVTIFQITKEGKLQWVEAYRGEAACFQGTRGIAMHPDGKTMFIPSSGQSLLTVASRDAESGKLQITQTLRDGEKGVEGLAGVSSVACSPDGKFLYVSSGRFWGDNAIGVYQIGEDRLLSKVQELFNGKDGLTKFEGGNKIHVSPDGKHVYVNGTLSETLLDFQRDEKTGQLSSPEVTEFRTLEWLGPRLGPAGVGLSPDGKHAYVALESTGKIAILKRMSASVTKTEEKKSAHD